MATFKLCESGRNGLCKLELVPHTFDFSQTIYHATFEISGKVNNQDINETYVYRITPPSGKYPVMRVGNTTLSTINAPSYITEASSTLSVIHNLLGFGNTSNLNFTIEQISHTGSGVITMPTSSMSITDNFYGEPPVDGLIRVDADFPIFASGYELDATPPLGTVGQCWEFNNASDETYMTEIYNGDFTHVELAGNYESLADTVLTNDEYFIYSQVKRDNETIFYKGFKFAILPDTKISLAHVNDEWILDITEMPYKYMDLSNGGYSSMSWTEANSILSDHLSYPYNEDYTEGGHNYTVWLYTNIPRFDSQEEQTKYNNGEIGIDSAIDGGGSAKLSPIGEGISSSNIDTSTFDSRACGSNIYLMTNTEMMNLKNYLFDPNHKTDLQDGLWLWGNTPASVIIALFYVPFSVSDFYTTDSAGVKFGSHVATDLGYYTIGTIGGKRKTLFQTTFEGKYGDFRDYEYMTYELYLPFVGRFIELDANKYLNKIIKCEMLFDAYKHEIRYYLFANGILQDRIDCVCGVDMPLISTDNVSKAKTDISTRFDDINNIANGISGAMMGRVGLGSIVSSVSGLIENKMTRAQKPTETVQGGFSSSLNTFDIRYPYLRITETLTVKPTSLNSQYNYPSYYIGKASQLSGYCECEDIKLKSNCTESEYNEIKDLLKGGVIF